MTTNVNARSVLAHYSVPFDVLPEMKMKKLEGFKNFRANTRLIFKPSTSPFVSGQICVFFYARNGFNDGSYVITPGSSTYAASLSPSIMTSTQVTSLTSATGSPHVIMDLASGEPVEIVVPFISPVSHWDMTAYDPTSTLDSTIPVTFDVVVCAYSTIWTEDKFSIQVLVSFEDIDLSFPTYPTRVLSGQRTLKVDKLVHLGLTREKALEYVFNENSRPPLPIPDIQNFEMQGLVSIVAGTANAILHAADPITKHVPILSTVSDTAKGVLPLASDLASAFGFSKETFNSHPEEFQQRLGGYSQNVDGLDNSRIFGLSSSNNLSDDNNTVGMTEDEMSFAHIFSRYEYIGHFVWRRVTPAGTSLAKVLVTPLICDQDFGIQPIPSTAAYQPSPAGAIVTPTHLAYLGHMFWMWRGSLIYRFRFVKTSFHVGRIRIMWLPGDQDKDYDPSVTYNANNPEASYFIQKIVDLRETNEVDFEVPFASNRPYNYCDGVAQGANVFPNYISNGTLLVQSLTDLSAPDTVRPGVEVLVEIKAGDDFEYSNFKGNPWFLPYAITQNGDPGVSVTYAPGYPSAAGPTRAETYGGIIPDSTGGVEPATHVVVDNVVPITTAGVMNVNVTNKDVPVTIPTQVVDVNVKNEAIPITTGSTLDVNVVNNPLYIMPASGVMYVQAPPGSDGLSITSGDQPLDVMVKNTGEISVELNKPVEVTGSRNQGDASRPIAVKVLVPSIRNAASGTIPSKERVETAEYCELSMQHPVPIMALAAAGGTYAAGDHLIELVRDVTTDGSNLTAYTSTIHGAANEFYGDINGTSLKVHDTKVVPADADPENILDETHQMFTQSHVNHADFIYEMQSGLRVDGAREVSNTNIIPEPQLHVSKTTSGEVISSIRALTNIFTLNSMIDHTVDKGKAWRPNGFTFSPQSMRPMYGISMVTDSLERSFDGLDLSSDSNKSFSTHCPDLLDAFSIMYGYWKGSVRSKTLAMLGGPSTAEVFMRPSQSCSGDIAFPLMSSPVIPCVRTPFSIGPSSFTQDNVASNHPSYQVFIGNDVEARCIELQHPYYQPLVMSRVSPFTSHFKSPLYDQQTAQWHMPANLYSYVFEESSFGDHKLTRHNRYKIFRAAGNDFNFHFLQGLPPMARSTYSQYGEASPQDPMMPLHV